MKTVIHEDHNEDVLDLCPTCGQDRPGCECSVLPCGCIWKPGDCPLHAQAEGMREFITSWADTIPPYDTDEFVRQARALLRAIEEKQDASV